MALSWLQPDMAASFDLKADKVYLLLFLSWAVIILLVIYIVVFACTTCQQAARRRAYSRISSQIEDLEMPVILGKELFGSNQPVMVHPGYQHHQIQPEQSQQHQQGLSRSQGLASESNGLSCSTADDRDSNSQDGNWSLASSSDMQSTYPNTITSKRSRADKKQPPRINSPIILKYSADYFVQEIDAFIRHRDDFYSPGYYYSVKRLEQSVKAPPELRLKSFVAFLKTRPEFRLTRDQRSVELVALTPFRKPGVQVYGEFRCAKMNCKNRWGSAHSFADSYQLCSKCRRPTYPFEQRPLVINRPTTELVEGEDVLVVAKGLEETVFLPNNSIYNHSNPNYRAGIITEINEDAAMFTVEYHCIADSRESHRKESSEENVIDFANSIYYTEVEERVDYERIYVLSKEMDALLLQL